MTDPRPLVLIADDDMEIRALVRRALGDLDCDLIEAFDGEDALEKIIVEAPDLVVLDVMMPTLTGWDNHRWVRYRALVSALPDFLASFAAGRAARERGTRPAPVPSSPRCRARSGWVSAH